MGDQQRNFPEWEINRPRVGIPTMGTPRVSLSNQLNPVLVSLENSTPCVGRLTRGVFLPTQGVFVSCAASSSSPTDYVGDIFVLICKYTRKYGYILISIVTVYTEWVPTRGSPVVGTRNNTLWGLKLVGVDSTQSWMLK